MKLIFCYFVSLAKGKKTPEETASIFEAMAKAMVKGNPKPKKKATKRKTTKEKAQ